MENEKTKIAVICGPTGIGKTSLAIRLAGDFHGEIVSADSMQIYRYMDIGTAKPTIEEQNQVTHHLIDIAYPDEPFDALTYSVSGREVIGNLRERGIFPMVVGGTGLYIQALLFGLFPQGANETEVRGRLKKELERDGPSRMHQRLEQMDPESACNIHPHVG